MPGESCPFHFSSQPSQMLRIQPELSRIQSALQQKEPLNCRGTLERSKMTGPLHLNLISTGGAGLPTSDGHFVKIIPKFR